MSDREKTERLFLAAEQQERRTRYEALLDNVLKETHSLVEMLTEIDIPVDDSAIHETLQRLRDEFGPGELT
jgi:hypothetical protein